MGDPTAVVPSPDAGEPVQPAPTSIPATAPLTGETAVPTLTLAEASAYIPATAAAVSAGAAPAWATQPPLPAPSGALATVTLPACFDFDTGAGVAPSDPDCDFNILPGPDSGTVLVQPLGAAQLAYGGVFPAPPSEADCTGSPAYSKMPEIVAPLAAMYVCYRTGAGRTGYVHFTDAELEQAYTLSFEWHTFPGSVPPPPTPPQPPPPDLTYRSESYAFHLTLPGTWQGYRASETVFAAGEQPDVASVCFTFSGSPPFCILKVDVWTHAAWGSLSMIPDGYYLGENEAYVFAAGPYSAECLQLDEFQCALRHEVPGILRTFVAEPTAQPPLTYHNPTFGFLFTLPATWEGYGTTQNGNDGVTGICFSFPASGPVCVLQIDVYTHAAWEALAMVPEGYYLGENDRYVFASGPHPPDCVQLDPFQCARYREIPGILAGFTVK